MFTGLIETVGSVVRCHETAHGSRLTIAAGTIAEELPLGASIAVDGVCLTALEIAAGTFQADVSPETLARTSLAGIAEGMLVNLERPLAVGDRLGGHFVQGHVDGVTREIARRDEGDFLRVTYVLPPELAGFLVKKGSVALNGVSLTVASLDADSFDVQLVPHTLEATNLTRGERAEQLNMEVDILGKYVARMLEERFAAASSPDADGRDKAER